MQGSAEQTSDCKTADQMSPSSLEWKIDLAGGYFLLRGISQKAYLLMALHGALRRAGMGLFCLLRLDPSWRLWARTP